MHRFYLPSCECSDAVLTLRGAGAHHARNVLRSRQGDQVSVLNGRGIQFLCEVGAVERHQVQLKVLQTATIAPSPYRISLLQGIAKSKAMDWIVQKATELGVSQIVPLISERSTVHVDANRAEEMRQKWSAIAVEAMKQSGGAWLPEIARQLTPDVFLERDERFDLSFLASLRDQRHHARTLFERWFSEHRRYPETVCVWVGPEGDFSPAETDKIHSRGAVPISLGPLVLRSETAAVYCLSILQHELQFNLLRKGH